MQIDKKKIIIISLIAVVILGLIGLLVFNKISKDKKANEYYYTFKYDDNLITQSVWVYNGNDELQTNYYLLYNDEPVTFTTGEKAVLTMVLLDLKDHPEITMKFKSDVDELDTKAPEYKVVYKDKK